jgi:hypothetical protein
VVEAEVAGSVEEVSEAVDLGDSQVVPVDISVTGHITDLGIMGEEGIMGDPMDTMDMDMEDLVVPSLDW